MKHWLGQDVIEQRSALCGEIIAILTSSINTMQASLNDGNTGNWTARETEDDYVTEKAVPPPDSRHSTLNRLSKETYS